MRVVLLTTAALTGFAANSLLTRSALGSGALDAPGFTVIRLATGALTLAILLRVGRTDSPARTGAGSWFGGIALAGYATAFTVAYTKIGAAVGALLLFGAVQVTMIGVGLSRGERLGWRDWLALALAAAGLGWLTVPGASAPHPLGAGLMIVAGACWGVYSLAGRGSRHPLADTASNFWRAALLCGVALAAAVSPAAFTWKGAALATASGALASGVGYTLWYMALPHLAAWRAALLQMSVPVITAIAASLLLAEAITPRLVVSAGLVAAGVALSIRWGTPRRF